MRDLHHPVSIKTSPPALGGVIERERLIKALADLPAAAKWLQSPSGTGKSTLAASYARSRNKPLVWYRLDERDNDPAFFYDEFERALRAQGVTAPLPKFSGDDHDRQQQFAQRFIDALTAQFADKPALIVMDDAQRVTSAEIQVALAALVSIAVNQSELLFVSESTVPGTFFDAIAARQLALLNDADLHFDADECKAMTAALRVGAAESDSIATLTGGHAGALVLACELLRGTDPKSALGSTTVERIHSHLLTKLVERMSEPRRNLLVQTAFVTHLTRPIAETLAGQDASQELNALAESGLFRRVESEDGEVFEAHGLVRLGMQALARARLGQVAARGLAERTARALEENRQREAAFSLLVEIGSVPGAIDVLRKLAEDYAAHGHIDLLMGSIGKLPAVEVQGNPWLCFWTGQALLRVDEEQARAWFASSYSAFEGVSDAFGARLTAASMVIAFGLEHADLRELELWMKRHRDAGGETPVPSNERFESTFLMAMMCVALMQGGYPQQVPAQDLIPRFHALLEFEGVWLSGDQRVQAGRLLITHARIFHNHIEPLNAIVATRRLIQENVGGALHRGRWLISAAWANFEQGNAPASLQHLEQARVLASEIGSLRLHFELSFALTSHWIKAQMLQEAAAELDRLEHLAEGAPPAQRAEFARIMARLLLLQGQHAEGLRWADDAMRLAVPAGFSGANLNRYEVELVYALAANERLTDALALIRRQESLPPQAGVAIAHCLEFLITDSNDLPTLQKGLSCAEEINFLNLLDGARDPLTRICEAALAHDIHATFVRRLIAVKKLRPSLRAGPSWPWPVCARTLGEFRLVIDGHSYQPSHKAQDKPLELLKLLITCLALGRESAEKNWIAERLWADSEGSNARKSLDMTIGRLRKLLRCDDAIVVNEGRVQLSSTHVWTDIAPLRRAFADLSAASDAHARGGPTRTAQATASINAVLSLYKGIYLAEEEGPPWLLAGREAMASGVRHALLSAEWILQGKADVDLIPALQQALMHDPTSEDLARSLMRAHLRCGQNSEAVGVYRRLRNFLSLVMGLAPSVETEHIRSQALSQKNATH